MRAGSHKPSILLFLPFHLVGVFCYQVINITAQSSKKIPKKWLCVGAHAPTHNHFFGYLWQWMRSSDATLRCNIKGNILYKTLRNF